MKRFSQIFQALLGFVALICTTLIAAGRLVWCTVGGWWRKRSKWVRIVVVAILIVIPVGFMALVGYVYHDSDHDRCYWRDESLSKHVEIHGFQDYKYRLYNRCTGEYTTSKVNWVSEVPENDSLVVYALPNKRGYINAKNGEIVIDAQTNDYRKAWVFAEGLAAVVKDGKIGFINAENELVIPFKFGDSDKCRMSPLNYLFCGNYCVMTNADGDLGLIDRNGDWVLDPVYDEIRKPQDNGMRIVIQDGKYGVLDSLLQMVCPLEYDFVEIVPGGFVLTQGGKMWQEDMDGNIVRSFMFGWTYYLSYPVGYDDEGCIESSFSDYVKYEIHGRYGIMNRITGKPITLAIYKDINMLSRDLFEVQDSESSNCYLLDANGNIVER